MTNFLILKLKFMKKTIRISWVNSLVGVALSTILFSFSSMPGAHSVQVYLDDKLVIDHYIDEKTQVPKVVVDPSENYTQLIVKYSECGRTVTGRTITLKTPDSKVLKEWRFEGASAGYKDPMAISTKEITGLKQKGTNNLSLFYSSNEFPEGQQVASLVIGTEATTALK
jgi:hypothetical protein